MVKMGIVLGYVTSRDGIEVDKAKNELIASLPTPTCTKEGSSFLGYAGLYLRFI